MKHMLLFALAAWIALPFGASVQADGLKVGVARVEITPETPTWLAGYGSRDHAAEGTAHPLWAKALAIADDQGNQTVIVTTDVLGLTRQIGDAVAEGVKDRGLRRDELVLSATHTHCGPVVVGCADVAHRMDDEALAVARQYRDALTEKLIAVIRDATEAMQPAELYFTQTETDFAMNRRLPQDGRVVMRPNPQGPVDHSVPVLVAQDSQGKPLAVLFGYACHNTTLGGDCYLYNGDYSGFAMIELEQALPGATAMFISGCGADANPEPRAGDLAMAKKHGQTIAAAVEAAIKGNLQPVHGPIETAMRRVDLELVDPPQRATVESWAKSGDVYRQRLGRQLLHQLEEEGQLPASYPCPVQVVRFSDDLVMVAIGGEVVVGYALRLKRELPDEPLWVAGYCNEVFGYVPTEKVLAEGGYEADFSQIYFGFHGPYKPGLEDKLISAAKELVSQTRP